MNMANPKFLKYWIPVLIYATIIFINSSMSPHPLLEESEIPLLDKALHLLSYAVLGYLLSRALLNYGYNITQRQLFLMAVLLGTLYGISDEVHQYFVPERMAEVADVVFDFFGSAIGAVVYNRGFKDVF